MAAADCASADCDAASADAGSVSADAASAAAAVALAAVAFANSWQPCNKKKNKSGSCPRKGRKTPEDTGCFAQQYVGICLELKFEVQFRNGLGI